MLGSKAAFENKQVVSKEQKKYLKGASLAKGYDHLNSRKNEVHQNILN